MLRTTATLASLVFITGIAHGQSASVQGDTRTYMNASRATMGAYTGADASTTGTIVRIASR